MRLPCSKPTWERYTVSQPQILPRIFTQYCPRCNRPKKSTLSLGDALEQVKKHVEQNHPDYDPEWYDTYPTIEPL
jgi:hypothetical protein